MTSQDRLNSNMHRVEHWIRGTRQHQLPSLLSADATLYSTESDHTLGLGEAYERIHISAFSDLTSVVAFTENEDAEEGNHAGSVHTIRQTRSITQVPSSSSSDANSDITAHESAEGGGKRHSSDSWGTALEDQAAVVSDRFTDIRQQLTSFRTRVSTYDAQHLEKVKADRKTRQELSKGVQALENDACLLRRSPSVEAALRAKDKEIATLRSQLRTLHDAIEGRHKTFQNLLKSEQ